MNSCVTSYTDHKDLPLLPEWSQLFFQTKRAHFTDTVWQTITAFMTWEFSSKIRIPYSVNSWVDLWKVYSTVHCNVHYDDRFYPLFICHGLLENMPIFTCIVWVMRIRSCLQLKWKLGSSLGCWKCLGFNGPNCMPLTCPVLPEVWLEELEKRSLPQLKFSQAFLAHLSYVCSSEVIQFNFACSS